MKYRSPTNQHVLEPIKEITCRTKERSTPQRTSKRVETNNMGVVYLLVAIVASWCVLLLSFSHAMK